MLPLLSSIITPRGLVNGVREPVTLCALPLVEDHESRPREIGDEPPVGGRERSRRQATVCRFPALERSGALEGRGRAQTSVQAACTKAVRIAQHTRENRSAIIWTSSWAGYSRLFNTVLSNHPFLSYGLRHGRGFFCPSVSAVNGFSGETQSRVEDVVLGDGFLV